MDGEWPAYFIGRDLRGARQRLRKGDPWPWQNKQIIRAWSQAYGVPDDGRPFHELDFVTVLVAPTAEAAAQLATMPLDQARRYLKELAR